MNDLFFAVLHHQNIYLIYTVSNLTYICSLVSLDTFFLFFIFFFLSDVVIPDQAEENQWENLQMYMEAEATKARAT